MGANLCTIWRRTPHQKPNSSASTTHGKPCSDSTKFINFTKLSNCFKIRIPTKGNHKTQNLRRKTKLETSYQKKAIIKTSRKLTLEDLILASPSLMPEYLKKSGSELLPFKHRKKRVHPSRKVSASAISEAKDSLERVPNKNLHCQEGVEKSEILSISGSLSRNSQKKVRFKLPHDVILYSPDELNCREEGCSVYESDEARSTREDLVDSPVETKWIEGSSDTPEGLRYRLAVHTLPNVPVSSAICV